MDTLLNYSRINATLATAGQPTEAQFIEVKAAGVEVVVNLALLTSPGALPDEKASVEALGMNYLHLPVDFEAPTREHFRDFEAALQEHSQRSLLVHCAYNWRATSFAAAYAERHLGWSAGQAARYRNQFWQVNAVWEAWATDVTSPLR